MLTRKIFTGAAALIIATGLSAAPALAGGSHVSYGAHYGGGYGGGHGGYSVGYGHSFGGHHGGYRGEHHGGHHGGHGLAIAVPLALFAGVLIANSSRPRARTVAYPAPPPQAAPAGNVWVQQAPAQNQSHASDAYCREYTSQIVIDGQAQRAYGQACRQEDGSWKIMSQNFVPDFN